MLFLSFLFKYLESGPSSNTSFVSFQPEQKKALSKHKSTSCLRLEKKEFQFKGTKPLRYHISFGNEIAFRFFNGHREKGREGAAAAATAGQANLCGKMNFIAESVWMQPAYGCPLLHLLFISRSVKRSANVNTKGKFVPGPHSQVFSRHSISPDSNWHLVKYVRVGRVPRLASTRSWRSIL